MGEQTGIEWTDHTFNPWWGCTRVSPACEHCYAETWAARFAVGWGPKAQRKPASEKTWREPLKWNRTAEREGRRHRVFCASMADVFEDRRDLDALRARLFDLIAVTPHLDWQLLTKRPQWVMQMVPESWLVRFPRNVWIGTTVEDQRRADERIPHLLMVPAAVHFLSCEPLLGPVDLLARSLRSLPRAGNARLRWVICGGESGKGARPMHPDWARSLRDQCAEVGVPFFHKQNGEWAPAEACDGALRDSVSITHVGDDGHEFWRIGKKAAGSLLDGVEHKAFPEV